MTEEATPPIQRKGIIGQRATSLLFGIAAVLSALAAIVSIKDGHFFQTIVYIATCVTFFLIARAVGRHSLQPKKP